MFFKNVSILALVFLVSQVSGAYEIDQQIQSRFLQMGGPAKALSHLSCFMQNFDREVFRVKRAKTLDNRCNVIEGGSRSLTIGNFNKAVIVDYTVPSTQRRFYLLDLSKQNPELVKSYYVSHGRYGSTPRSNTTPGPRSNTIKNIKHYSNVSGSNASSSGFYISGFKYRGRWDGAAGNKNSLVLHGIEKNVNDNACDRAIVVHGNSYINESGRREGVRRMSSGCYMLDYDHVNEVVDAIRGGGGPFHQNENRDGGVVFLTYGLREAKLESNHYCLPEARSGLHIED